MDTLSKSRKDAEEECKERLALTQAQRNSRRSDKRWQDEENEPVDYLDLEEQGTPLDAVSIEKCLTYNSPMIASLSRISNWDDLAILRPFEESILQGVPDERLSAYDNFLDQMHMDTKRQLARCT